MTTSTATVIQFPARGSFSRQDDLFLASSATLSSTSIVGLVVKQAHAPCRRCGAVHFIIGSSGGPHYARLTCTACNSFAGWMPKGEFTYASMTIEKFDRPTDPFAISEEKNRG